MDHLYHHQSLPVSKGQTGVSGDNNNSSSNNNNNWSTSLGSTSSRHQTAKGGNNNSYSRSNSGNFGKQNQQQNQQQQNNNRSVRFPSKHHQRNGGGGGREPKQTVLGQQLHFEDNNGYQQYSTRGSYLGGGGYRGNRRNNNHKTTHAAANNGSNHGKVSAKERFVQANSQFVMSPFNDNSEHLKDPDAPITWGLVEEVIFSSNSGDEGLQSSSIVCPVCLSTPVAGKVTRCGHIYCWSCILHYLALSDKDSRACPICFETISKGELKSVCIVNRIDYSPADHLTFALMKVRKGCTLALPANFDFDKVHGSSPNHRIQRGTNGTLDQFAKVFTASPHYMTAIFDRERADLTEQLLEYEREQMPEVCFVHAALEELAKRQEDYEAMGSSLALCQQLASLEASLSCSTEQQNLTEASAADYNYFYQSEDGQSIYLHPLNVRMLKAEYGELKSCPARITAKIVDLHGEGVHGPAKERRYVYLRHLPLSCEYKIAEVEFTTSGDEDGVLSPSTVADFAAEVAARKKDRQRKEKALRARDRRIEVENKRKIYGIAAVAPTNFQLDNVADFPAYLPVVDAAPFAVGAAAVVDSSSTTSSSSNIENNMAAELGLLPELGSSPPLPPPTAGSSFAKMLGNAGGPSANFFDHTLRKKAATSSAGGQAAGAGSGEDEDEAAAAALAMQSMNITLGDFFENCIKTKSKKGKGGRKGKK